MAKPYFEQLNLLLEKFDLDSEQTEVIKVKHFFNGAAAYSNGTIISSLSPMGLAFKLPEREVDQLLKNGEASPLKYFEKGNVKKGYAMFREPNLNQVTRWKSHFLHSLQCGLKTHNP